MWIAKITRAETAKPLKFLIVGVGNTAVGISVIFLIKWIGGTDIVANVFGYMAGLTLSFTLNRKWTFRHSGTVLSGTLRFLAVFGIAYMANLFTVLSLIKIDHVNSYLAQILGMLSYTVTFYLGARFYAFPSAPDGQSRVESNRS